jgi:hypothetical protein
MMPLGLFWSPVFSGANAMTLLLYFPLSGVLFFLPFNKRCSARHFVKTSTKSRPAYNG